MDIALVGGLSRLKSSLEDLASRRGHRLFFHSGETKGRGSDELQRIIDRSDVVVVVTEVNSHNGVQLVKKECRFLGRPYVVVRRCSMSGCERLLGELEASAHLAKAS